MPNKATFCQRQQHYAQLGRNARNSTTFTLAHSHPPTDPPPSPQPGNQEVKAEIQPFGSRFPALAPASSLNTSSTIKNADFFDEGESQSHFIDSFIRDPYRYNSTVRPRSQGLMPANDTVEAALAAIARAILNTRNNEDGDWRESRSPVHHGRRPPSPPPLPLVKDNGRSRRTEHDLDPPYSSIEVRSYPAVELRRSQRYERRDSSLELENQDYRKEIESMRRRLDDGARLREEQSNLSHRQTGPTPRERELQRLLRQNVQSLEDAKVALQTANRRPTEDPMVIAENDRLYCQVEELRLVLANENDKLRQAEVSRESATKHQSVMAKTLNELESKTAGLVKRLAEEVRGRSMAQQQLAEDIERNPTTANAMRDLARLQDQMRSAARDRAEFEQRTREKALDAAAEKAKLVDKLQQIRRENDGLLRRNRELKNERGVGSQSMRDSENLRRKLVEKEGDGLKLRKEGDRLKQELTSTQTPDRKPSPAPYDVFAPARKASSTPAVTMISLDVQDPLSKHSPTPSRLVVPVAKRESAGSDPFRALLIKPIDPFVSLSNGFGNGSQAQIDEAFTDTTTETSGTSPPGFTVART